MCTRKARNDWVYRYANVVDAVHRLHEVILKIRVSILVAGHGYVVVRMQVVIHVFLLIFEPLPLLRNARIFFLLQRITSVSVSLLTQEINPHGIPFPAPQSYPSSSTPSPCPPSPAADQGTSPPSSC